ncbi:AEC family transporter [Salinisphaera sp. P385]|uniref:AEC family transporter n=1 Tax=Spectribacter acetivorans TaxID=3075603 RepID=A0ABU3B4W6_9GAMM|nr:AEC family transporter [Salinisphaera sp. P385]MDT0617498.1 AEC family transporter [Salinisphaera sp. P385]
MIRQLLEITVPVFGIVLLSFAYGRWRPTEMATANRLNIVLFIPALIFHALTERTGEDLPFTQLTLATLVIVLGSGLIAWPLARLAGWQPSTLVPPAMFNNSGNMGLPLAVLAFGADSLPAAVVLLVVTNVLQFTVGLWVLQGRLDLPGLIRHPMLLATAAGLVALALDWRMPAMIEPGVRMLGDVAIPLMLVALGMRLSEGGIDEWRLGLVGGLLTPLTGLLIAVPWVWWTQPVPPLDALIILYAALPPAVMNYMLAEQAGRDSSAVAAIVAIGNALALIVIPVTLVFIL